jgi:UDP-N-acetylglucosamine acyltransferase
LQEEHAMTLAISDLIHPTAVISSDAEIAADVQVGPFTIIDGPVRIGPGCILEGHVCLSGPLEMGRNNFIGHGSVLGKDPQSRAYKGEPTSLRIGNGNTFREYTTVHRGTVEGGGITILGDGNLLMVSAHVGHDAHIGNNCTLVNNCLVAGHVEMADNVILSGHAAVQQKTRIGRLAMLGGQAASTRDVPPFILQQGYNCVTGLNVIGLRRAGMPRASIDALRAAFRILYREGRTHHEACDRIEADHGAIPEVMEFVTFVRKSVNGINPSRDEGRQNWDL